MYYVAIKKNKALIHAKTGINLGNIVLNERSRSQKVHILYDLMHMKPTIRKPIETEKR